MSLFDELKRRNVFRVGIAYAVVAWLLLQLTEVLSELLNLPDPVGPIVVAAVAIGFPFALFFAWAFELTPEGIKREEDVRREASITTRTGRKLDRTITILLAVAVAYLLLDKLLLQDRFANPVPDVATAPDETAPAVSDASVAVLPFLNMSGDPENEYFSDGLTDTLLHMLAQLPDLRVAARTSSFAFKGKDPTVDEVARTLKVAHILEGSVQRAGGQVRVTAQLIRADDGFHVWSQNYTRPLEDIFTIQDEIAADVAGALGASLGVAGEPIMEGVETRSLSAYDHYLHGLDEQSIGSWQNLDTAEDSFKQALVRDAAFTDARMALVRNYFMKRLTGMLTSEQLRQVARPLLDQVKRDDPDNRLAPLFEHMLVNRFGNENVNSMEEVRLALENIRVLLERAPTESFMRAEIAGGFSAILEEHETALEILDTGLLIDPLEPELFLMRGSVMMEQEDYEEAERAFLRAVELRPEMPSGYSHLSQLARRTGDYPAALDWMRRAAVVDPKDHELQYRLALDLYTLKLPEEAERWYTRVQALAPGTAFARHLEIERARARGNTDRVLELAWGAIEDGVDDRLNAHGRIAFNYVNGMMADGRAQEAFDRIGNYRPETHRWSEIPGDAQGRDLQWSSFHLLFGFAPAEVHSAAWREMRAAFDETGFPWRESGSHSYLVNALVEGQFEDAVASFLERHENRPITYNPRMQDWLGTGIYQPLHDDPRVLSFLTRREQSLEKARTEVQAMLQKEEWTTP